MRPIGRSVRPIGMVSLQGTYGYFYVPTSVYLGRVLARQGYRYVSVNTRAREVASMDIPWPFSFESELQARLGGESWYRFDEEPHDVAGWIDFMMAQGPYRSFSSATAAAYAGPCNTR